jgi:flavin-dependent dehydrogenase
MLADGGRTICGCQGYIRATGPILPLVEGGVWAVGEAGGIVDPLTALGIVPAMVSARLLVDNWDDAAGYEAAVFKKYGWFKQTAQVVNTLLDRNTLRIWSPSLLRRYADFIGLRPRAGWLIHPNLFGSLMQFTSILGLYRSMKRPQSAQATVEGTTSTQEVKNAQATTDDLPGAKGRTPGLLE